MAKKVRVLARQFALPTHALRTFFLGQLCRSIPDSPVAYKRELVNIAAFNAYTRELVIPRWFLQHLMHMGLRGYMALQDDIGLYSRIYVCGVSGELRGAGAQGSEAH